MRPCVQSSTDLMIQMPYSRESSCNFFSSSEVRLNRDHELRPMVKSGDYMRCLNKRLESAEDTGVKSAVKHVTDFLNTSWHGSWRITLTFVPQ